MQSWYFMVAVRMVKDTAAPGFHSKLINVLLDFRLGFPRFFLDTAQQLIFLTFHILEIVVGKLTVFLFQFTLDLVPVSLDLIRCRTHGYNCLMVLLMIML